MSTMLKEPSYQNQFILCKCGHKTRTYFADALSDELHESDSFEDELEDTTTVICDHCGMPNELTMKVEKSIVVTYATVTPIGMGYVDKDDTYYAANNLALLSIGDEVPLLDGRYVNIPYEYHVTNGKIEHIYSALIDENQLNLFEESIL